MKDTLKEAKSVLAKANDDMAQYYNCRRSPAPFFSPSDMVYLDSEDIQTTRPSKKLSHRRLGPYPVERRVGKYAYHLVLPPLMRRLHPVFNVMKLSPAPNDPISQNPPPLPELVDGEEEYVVEKILNSRMFQQKLQYLVKWEGYGIEGNTWEYSENLDHAPEKVPHQEPGGPTPHPRSNLWLDPFPPNFTLLRIESMLIWRGGDCKGNPSHFPFPFPFHFHLPLTFCFHFHLPLPLPACPSVLHLPPPTHHRFQPASH